MDIKSFNTKPSQKDLQSIENLFFNSDFNKRVYAVHPNPERCLFITSSSSFNQTVSGYSNDFCIESLSFVKTEFDNLDYKLVSFLPSTFSTFEAFKSELNVFDISDLDAFILENEKIHQLIISQFETDLKRKDCDNLDYLKHFMLKNKQYLIYDKNTHKIVTVSDNTFYYFHNGSSVHLFNSIDLALKPIFESIENFQSERSRAFNEYLNSEETEKRINEYFKEINEENERKKEFFQSERFNELMEIILPEKLVKHSISSNDFLYNCDIDFIDQDEFNLLTSCLAQNITMVDDEEENFPTSYGNYKNIQLRITHGQGSIYSLSLTE